MAEPNGHISDSDVAKPLAENPSAVNVDPMTGEPSVEEDDGETVFGLLRRFSDGIFNAEGADPLSRRLRSSFAENLPRVQRACGNSGHDVLLWTRRGSPLRALLVISVGTISLISLSGLAVFMLFFMVATLNAVIISLLMSLAAVGGLLALFLSCLVTIYIGVLFVAAFIISIVTISTVTAALVTAGWVGFAWAIYIVAKKGMEITKRSLTMAGSVAPTSTAAESQRHESKED